MRRRLIKGFFWTVKIVGCAIFGWLFAVGAVMWGALLLFSLVLFMLVEETYYMKWDQ